jgi:hypothetical protein
MMMTLSMVREGGNDLADKITLEQRDRAAF